MKTIQRIYRFDTAKAILMVLVVVQHSFFSYFQIEHSRDLTEAARFLCLSFTMPLFACLSGWFMKRTPDKVVLIKQFFICIVFNFIGNILARWAGYRTSWVPLVISVSMWYMWVLTLCRFVVPAISRVPGYVCIAFLASWSVCFIPARFGMRLPGRFFGFLPFFALGHFVANSNAMSSVRKSLLNEVDKWWCFKYLLPLVILYLAGFLFTASGMDWRLVHDGLGHMTFGGGVVGVRNKILFQSLACLMGFLFLKCIPNHPNRISELGCRTLPVYLFHIWFVLLGVKIVKHFRWMDATPQHYVVMTVAFMFCLLLFHPVFMCIVKHLSDIPLVAFRRFQH